MKRRIFNILAAVSLLLAVAIGGLWIQSYIEEDSYSSRRSKWSSTKGALVWTRVLQRQNRLTPPPFYGWSIGNKPVNPGFGPWFHLGVRIVDLGMVYRVVVPYAPCFVVALILPACWLICRKRWRTAAPTGFCPACGYDLRASKDKCPECGMAIATPTPSPPGRGPG